MQTAGEFLNWHPHLHVLAPAGAFRTDGGFVHSPAFDTVVLRDLFQANV
ncbi:MAG TPA: transposase [Candidatus Deferrimicrobiaceae bacterium]|nr:transposase [Candidatus Deferrimicrobiaceae bacterium]